MMAERVAARMKGAGAAGAAGPGGTTGSGGTAASGGMAGGGGRPGFGGAGPDGATRSAGSDLSQMLSRLPTDTIAGLKVGDAVMIVATSPSSDAETPMAVTLLVGVDPILRASPSGQTTTLSPWSLGGGAPEGGDAGGGPGGR